MDVTIYRYRIKQANWGAEKINEALTINIASSLTEQPFIGEFDESKYGFAQCISREKNVIGVFVQKFPTTLIDYDPITKDEIQKNVVDCGEYLFVLDFENYDIYLQSKRSTDLPNKEEIKKRFTSLLKLILVEKLSMIFSHLEETQDEVNREHIVELFYTESDKVIELDLDDFDINLINDQKRARGGKRQTYFNPIEEYQEAMEAAAIRLSEHADKTYIRAKKGESLKKDPIARAMLEGSRKPIKITYIKDGITYTEYGVTKNKLEISIEGDNFKLIEQVNNIVANIFGDNKKVKNNKKKDNGQTSFDL